MLTWFICNNKREHARIRCSSSAVSPKWVRRAECTSSLRWLKAVAIVIRMVFWWWAIGCRRARKKKLHPFDGCAFLMWQVFQPGARRLMLVLLWQIDTRAWWASTAAVWFIISHILRMIFIFINGYPWSKFRCSKMQFREFCNLIPTLSYIPSIFLSFETNCADQSSERP